jgi:hypothetical protein
MRKQPQRVASVRNRAPPHRARLARHCGNPANIAASGSEQSNSGSRAAVLSQAGAPLSWTRERADTFFRLLASEGRQRLTSASLSERSEQYDEEAADTLLVGERRRSRRLLSAIRSDRSEQSNTARCASSPRKESDPG